MSKAVEAGNRSADAHGEPRCPRCGQAFSILWQRVPLGFSCSAGHGWILRDLLPPGADTLRRLLEADLRSRGQRAEAIRRAAERLRQDGCAAVAESFQREASDQEDQLRRLVRELLQLAPAPQVTKSTG